MKEVYDEVSKRVYTIWSKMNEQSRIEDYITNRSTVDLIVTLQKFLRENTAKWTKALRPATRAQELIYVSELVKEFGAKHEDL